MEPFRGELVAEGLDAQVLEHSLGGGHPVEAAELAHVKEEQPPLTEVQRRINAKKTVDFV